VSDVQGEPLPGVNIRVQGTTTGTTTDVSGKYSIAAPGEQSVLQFSFIGFTQQDVVVGSQRTVNVTLEEDVKEFDEVVVVGYGTVRKSDLTGSVASVGRDVMSQTPSANVGQLIQSTAPGVVIMQDNAQPGAEFTIRVRGTTSSLASNNPLYVVDGLPLDFETGTPNNAVLIQSAPNKSPLNSINPADILSIEVLKDASATAIYGSRAANGVVLITTNRGKKGRPTINFNASTSFQKEIEIFDLAMALDYMATFNNYVNYRNNHPDATYHLGISPLTQADMKRYKDLVGNGTNWLKEIQRPRGMLQAYQLSFSGGSDYVNYYASFGYDNHEGLVKNTRMDRFTAKVNLDATVGKFKMGTSLITSMIMDQQVHFAGKMGGSQNDGVFNARIYPPVYPVYDDDGSFYKHEYDELWPSPMSTLTIDDDIHTKRIMGTFFGEYQIINGLRLRAEVGTDIADIRRGTYVPHNGPNGARNLGQAFIGNRSNTNYLANVLLYFNKTVNIHGFDAVAGWTYQNWDQLAYSTLSSNFLTDVFSYYNLGAGSVRYAPESERVGHALESFIARFNYSLMDKYLFTFTGRADGSTRFGKNNKWGFFPSGAVAWKMHNESFMSDLRFISEMKLRASYGITGNQEFANYQSLSRITSREATLGNQIVIGMRPANPENSELRWEKTTQLDVGLDFGLWNSRITGTVGYYNKLTSDLIQRFLVPQSTGYGSITANSGKVRNSGVEFNITSSNISGRDFTWKTMFNVAYNKNQWVDRAGLAYGIEDEFGPLGGIYGYVVEGVIQTKTEAELANQPKSWPGQYKFRDVKTKNPDASYSPGADGVINDADRILLGTRQPDWTFGLNNTFTWKNFDLNFFFMGMTGHRVSGGLYDQFSFGGLVGDSRHNISMEYVNLFDKDGNFDLNNKYKLSDGTGNVYVSGTNSISSEKADFLRLRNVTLGYQIPFKPETRISRMRVYIELNNLFTVTGYTGFNPESGNSQYPMARTYTIGLNVGF
jgi:TonB-linked SusC/RagA family outer membrane protein